jgi:hypothetical protein
MSGCSWPVSDHGVLDRLNPRRSQFDPEPTCDLAQFGRTLASKQTCTTAIRSLTFLARHRTVPPHEGLGDPWGIFFYRLDFHSRACASASAIC